MENINIMENTYFEAEDMDNVTEQDIEELEEMIEEYQSILKEHDEKVNDILTQINNSKVYQELGMEISVDTEYYYTTNEK